MIILVTLARCRVEGTVLRVKLPDTSGDRQRDRLCLAAVRARTDHPQCNHRCKPPAFHSTTARTKVIDVEGEGAADPIPVDTMP